MSKFNPTSWLNRSRVFSDSSVDVSAKSEASLAGLKYTSQSSMDISGSIEGTGVGVDGGGVLSPLPASAATATAATGTNEYTSSAKKSKTKLLRQWSHQHEEPKLQSPNPDDNPSGNDDEHLAMNKTNANANTPQQHNKRMHNLQQQQQQHASRHPISQQRHYHHARHKSMPIVSTSNASPSYHRHNSARDPQGYGPFHRDGTCAVELDAVRALRIDPTDDEDDGGEKSSSCISSSQGGEGGGNSRSGMSGRSGSYNSRSSTNHRSNYHSGSRRMIPPSNESFENASCISGLSADETHCDDGKSYKSTNSNANNSHQSKIPKGRDFGNAFDHLLHERYQEDDEHYYNSNNHSRSTPNSPRSTSNRRKQIRKPTHYRAQSDTMALHHHAYHHGRHHHHHHHQPSHHYPNNHHHHHPPTYHRRKKSLPAHATLREQIIANNVIKPQILQSRSTSLTTAQSQSTTSSSCAGGGGANSTQPLAQLLTSTTTGLRSVPSSGSGFSNLSHEQSEDGTATNSSSHSLNSTYYKQYNDLLGTRPRRKLHPSSAASSSSNNQVSYPSTEGEYTEDRSLQDVPEDDPSTNWNDAKSVDGSRSVLSRSTNGSIKSMTAGTPRSRKKVKDEMKFILKKFIPARLMMVRNNNVTLERSEGCLT